MASALTVIKNFMDSLNNTNKSGITALNEAVKSVSKFSSWSQLVNTMIADCKNYNGNGTAFLQRMCGINLTNSDTGAITGSDAGGGSTKTAESIIPESGAWKYPSKTTFTIQGLTVTVPAKKNLSSSQQYIVGALYTWWIKNSLTLIKNSYGLSFQDSGATVKKIDIKFYNGGSSSGLAMVTYGNKRKTDTLTMRINNYYFNNIDQSNPNGVGIQKNYYLDRTIVHELTHAVMAANIDYFSKLPTFIKEGTAELVHGIDDKRTDQIKSLASNSASLQKALVTGNNGTSAYSAGYIALRYFAKQAAANRKPSSSSLIAEDELFESAGNFSELDEIISTDNFISDNFTESNENIFSNENSQIYYGGKNQ